MSVPFEKMRVWHDARRLTARIYHATSGASFLKDSALRNQIRRAAISVMSNIAEGKERGTPRELAQFMRIAKGSAGEVRSQLYIAEDAGYLDQETARALRRYSASIARQIADVIKVASSG
jgi:four helix bundle protein